MRTSHLAALVCVGTLGAFGCEGKLSEIIPKDLSAHLTDGGDGGGGPMVDLGPAHFFPDIQADLDKADSSGLSCTNAACHGGTLNQPFLKPMPTADADKMANYMAFIVECDTTNPPNSSIIQNALGNNGHGGGVRFTMTDPQYDRWVNWIMDGELE